jgi:hypothetical protein
MRGLHVTLSIGDTQKKMTISTTMRCLYAERRYTECRYAECRGTEMPVDTLRKFQKNVIYFGNVIKLVFIRY